MDICKDVCQLDLEGEHKCCHYCPHKNNCGNPCDENPLGCNNLIVSDSGLLDYALDKFLNMNKVELIDTYLRERKDK